MILYCCAVWMECGATLSYKIKQLQTYGMQLITSSPCFACSAELNTTSRLKWMIVEQRRKLFRLSLVHKCLLGRAPQYLFSKLNQRKSWSMYMTRSNNNLYLKRPATNSFEYQGAFEWNHFPDNMKNIHTETTSKNYGKDYI